MATSKAYDDLLALKQAELRGEITGTSNSTEMTATGIPQVLPKRRGRPVGSKNKPKPSPA